MHKQPLFILCLFFIFGIAFREYVVLPQNLVYLLLSVSLLLFFTLISRQISLLRLKSFFTALVAFSFGVFLNHLNLKAPEIPDFGEKETIVFKISKKLNSNEKNRRYEATAFKDKQSFAVVISIPKDENELDFQHFYQAKVYLRKTEPPKNDYQFDYAKYLSRRNIFFQAYIPNGYKVAEAKNLSFWERIGQKRLEILQKIDKTNISPKSREFLKGIILADRTEMDSETVSDFSKTGLVHILAISGSHIVIIFGIFYWIFVKVFPTNFRKFAIISSLVFIWFFAVFIGLGSSVVRSCIMITAYFIYIMLQRKPDLLHSMALAAFAILALDTHQLYDIGFQLSFLAVFGIFWLNQPILKYFPIQNNFFKKLFFNTLSISLAAQIATLPLVLYYFHQFSLISIAANLVIIPLSEVVIIFSLLMVVLIAFNLNIAILDIMYDFVIIWLLKIIHWFSDFDALFHKNIPMNMIEVAILFIAIYFLRFLIVKFDWKNILRFSYAILVFFAVRFGFNYYEMQKDEVLVHHHFKDNYFSTKENGNVTFYVSENAKMDNVEKYLIDPYLTSRRTNNFEIKKLPKNSKQVEIDGKIYDLE